MVPTAGRYRPLIPVLTAILVATVAALLFAVGNAQGASPAAAPGCSANPPATFSNNAPTPIPDLTTTTSTINPTGLGGTILDVDVTTNIAHTFAADLDITLTSPAGTVVTLTTDNGGEIGRASCRERV